MRETLRYSGKPLVIVSNIINEVKLEQYPFRASLALQVERILTPADDCIWYVTIDVNCIISESGKSIAIENAITCQRD